MTLNGVEIDWWKSDDRGYFVAKFLASDVKGLLDEADDDQVKKGNKKKMVTLTLEGFTIDGTPFYGTDEVGVINVKAKK